MQVHEKERNAPMSRSVPPESRKVYVYTQSSRLGGSMLPKPGEVGGRFRLRMFRPETILQMPYMLIV